jgi:plastocyanin
MSSPVIFVNPGGYTPNPARVSLTDSGGYVTFKNNGTNSHTIVGLGGWSFSITLAPGTSGTVSIASLAQSGSIVQPTTYFYQCNDAGKTHIQGQIIVGP